MKPEEIKQAEEYLVDELKFLRSLDYESYSLTKEGVEDRIKLQEKRLIALKQIKPDEKEK